MDFTTALEHYGTNLQNIKLEYLNGIRRFKWTKKDVPYIQKVTHYVLERSRFRNYCSSVEENVKLSRLPRAHEHGNPKTMRTIPRWCFSLSLSLSRLLVLCAANDRGKSHLRPRLRRINIIRKHVSSLYIADNAEDGFLVEEQREKVGIGIVVISDRIAKIICHVIGNYINLYITDLAYSFIHKKREERVKDFD